MATRFSDLEDQTSGANLQTEGCANVLSQSQKDPEEMGALGSSPSHLPSWYPARRLPPSHPNTRSCHGIHVTLTEETGAVLPPSHTWTAPLVEDMLCYARTDLTKAVVMGPGRAVLFYGRCSLGEGLSLGKSRDATFMLIGVGTWVGKPAYLAVDPLLIQEGWQITQAIPKCQIKAMGPGHPHVNLLTPQPFRFDCLGDSPQRTPLEMPIQTMSYHPTGPQGARTTINVEETRGNHHLSPNCHPLIIGLKVIGVLCQWPPQCHHCQTDLKAPGIPSEVDNVGRPKPT